MMDLANEDTPQIYSACGKGTRSSMRVLRHGLPLTEMAVSELPGNPNGVWTVKKHRSDEYDTYIIVSFPNATLVLSIGETVEEVTIICILCIHDCATGVHMCIHEACVQVTDSGFLATAPTLNVTLLGDDALVQVHPSGIRHIRADKRINEWKPPGKKTIVKAALNERQVNLSPMCCLHVCVRVCIPANVRARARACTHTHTLCRVHWSDHWAFPIAAAVRKPAQLAYRWYWDNPSRFTSHKKDLLSEVDDRQQITPRWLP